jgi:hypothetical protein
MVTVNVFAVTRLHNLRHEEIDSETGMARRARDYPWAMEDKGQPNCI